MLLLWYLWPFVAKGARFPLGPDAPVYLWWTRLAGVDGLSAVDRPGVPALTLVLQGTLGLSVVQATAALEVVLGAAIGLASVALVRRSTTAWGAALAGLLAGTFAVHLAAGYVATLTMAAALLAAATLLDDPRLRAAVLAALVLAGGGLAHPDFLWLSVAIVLVAAAAAWRSERSEALRMAGAAAGGGAVLGLGLLAVRPGAPRLDVDTSKDAFLRRAGLGSELRSAYFDRFVHRWTRYVQWVSVPLAIAGFGAGRGNPGRILRAWFVVTFVGTAGALLTGWLPADRFVTFGFAVPILSALGLMWVWRRLENHRALAYAAIGVLTFLMVGGSAIAWNRQEPFMSEQEVRAITAANRYVAGVAPGGAYVFVVNGEGPELSFLATRAANVIRAGMPPSRVRGVFVYVPPPAPGAEASATRRALTRLTRRDLMQAGLGGSLTPRDVGFVLKPFNAVDYGTDAFAPSAEIGPGARLIAPRGIVRPAVAPVDPLEPASAREVVWGSIATLALLCVVGFGWARIGLGDPVRAVAISPAVGAAALILVAVALDALGISLGSTGGAVAASVLAGGGGYLVGLVLQRRARTHPAPQVEQQPAE
ncbi:MAG TPA: hypothetical protein VFM81_05470 [Actinomycetota bacterium]|nr:hypothetical protein [Actinomycetota bacterium]